MRMVTHNRIITIRNSLNIKYTINKPNLRLKCNKRDVMNYMYVHMQKVSIRDIYKLIVTL